MARIYKKVTDEKDLLERRAYQLSVYANKKLELISYLGGKCVKCGATEDLEFDHIDRSLKEYTILDKWTSPIQNLKEELDKCQLLCERCHEIKSTEELGNQVVKGQNIHGTISSYRYCKCDLCKKAGTDHNKEYRERTGRTRVTDGSMSVTYNPTHGYSASPYFNRIDEIIRLSKEGKSFSSIAEILGVPKAKGSIGRLVLKYKDKT